MLDQSQRQPEEPPPDEYELLAMAYADGELGPDEASAFVTRLRAEPELLRLVEEHRALHVLARQVGLPEPAEIDWSNLREDRTYRGTTLAGWILLVASVAIGAAVASGTLLLDTTVPAPARILAGAVVLGLALLFSSVLRRRLRAIPLDPYRHLQR